jgi:phospholipase/carboxylesterase
MSLRRQSFPLSYPPPRQPPFHLESGLFRATVGDTVHSVFGPMHYAPGYRYPLIVWLHGPGSDERQLMRIMPLVSMRNYVAVAPRGTSQKDASQPQREGYGWSQAEEHLPQAEQRIFDSIAVVAQEYNVHPERIFLAGFDAGGTMAFRVAMNYPQRFAGAISLSGAFPTGHAPLARLSEARHLSVFLAAGRRSAVYDETAVCADLRLLHAAGVSITLRSYPCGQELALAMFSDVDHWIIEHITSPQAAEDAP